MRHESRFTAGTERTKNVKTFAPYVDIYESKDEIVLLADMPGVAAENVDVVLEKNVLTIKGTLSPSTDKEHRLLHGEYETGDYRRQFEVSEEIDRDRIEATIKDGVLKVVLPKIEQAKARKIEIKAA